MDFFRIFNSNNDNGDNKNDRRLPVYPAQTLTSHVAMKGVQLGSVVGLLVATPAISFYKKVPISKVWSRMLPVFPVMGCSLTLSMLYVKHLRTPLDDAAVDDRAVRLSRNEGLLVSDRYSALGAAAGAALGVLVGNGRVGTTLASATTGLVAALLYFGAEKKGLLKYIPTPRL